MNHAMNRDELFEYLEGLRRDAYVRAVIRASESDDVVGYIGSHVPVDILESFGLMAIPVHGIDGEILSYSCEKNLCPLIDATVTYAKTDKCPLIHSAKLIVVDDFCPLMTREMMKLTDKNIFIYDGDNVRLIRELEDTYHRFKSEMQNEADELIRRLKNYSDIDGLPISNHFCFHDSPIEFTRVKVQSASGIYRQIDSFYGSMNYRIFEDFCNIHGNYDYVYENCPYCEGERINYTRG